MRNLFWIVLAWISFQVIPASQAFAESRFALVIGNADYRNISKLRNPVNDSRLLASVLSKNLGYKVYGGENLDRVSMIERVKNFVELVKRSGPNSISTIFFAGHGMEIGDENYLFPIDAVENITRENVGNVAVSLTFVMKQLQATKSRVQVLILDACRNDGTRSLQRGFRAISTPLGSLVAYSTAPGKTASDGLGNNSPFTEALAELVQSPGLSAEEVLFKVQDRVYRNTTPKQIPWVKPNLNGTSFSFNPVAAVPTAPKPVAAIRPSQRCNYAMGAYSVTNVDLWDHLNVRGSPEVPVRNGKSISNVSFKLPPGAEGIEVIPNSCTNGWCRIKYRCKEGWVGESFLSLSRDTVPQVANFSTLGPFNVAVPRGDTLSVREDPHHLAPLVGKLKFETKKVLVHHCVVPPTSTQTWCFVRHEGREGWSNSRYLMRAN